MPFRLQAKTLFLTYPQCNTHKEVALQRIIEHWNVDWACVAAELHSDGEPHLHAAVCLKEKLTTRDASFADFVADQHGNYQAARSKKNVLKYITKADQQPACYGIDPSAALEGSDGRNGINSNAGRIAALVQEGKTLEEIHEEMPGYFVTNLNKVQCYFAWRSVLGKRGRSEPWFGTITAHGTCPGAWDISGWLNRNIRQPRRFKQRQLYLHGPPDVGKTHLLDQLRAKLHCYELPKGEEFYDMWEDDCYDLVICDEFRADKTITFLNEFLQGTTMVIRKKGSQALKTHNIPVIIISNYHPRDIYTKVPPVALQALETRLHIVECGPERIDLKYCNNEGERQLHQMAGPYHEIQD